MFSDSHALLLSHSRQSLLHSLQWLCHLVSPSNRLHPKLVLVKVDVQDAEGMHVLVGQEWEQELVVQLTLLELELLWQRVA